MAYWKFLDYVNEDGTNEIRAWLEDLDSRARPRLDDLVEHLSMVKDLKAEKSVDYLVGDCYGLLAIKFRVHNVRYRAMSYHGPRGGEITMLVGAVKAGRRTYNPRNACAIAFQRQALVESDRRWVCDHE